MKKILNNILLSIVSSIVFIPIGYLISSAPGYFERVKLETFFGDMLQNESPVSVLVRGHTTRDVQGLSQIAGWNATWGVSELSNLLGEVGKNENINIQFSLDGKIYPKIDTDHSYSMIAVGGSAFGNKVYHKYSKNLLKYVSRGNFYMHKNKGEVAKNINSFLIFKARLDHKKTFIYLFGASSKGTKKAVSYFTDNYKTFMKRHGEENFLYLYEFSHDGLPPSEILREVDSFE